MMLERCWMTLASGWLLLAAGPALADCEGWGGALPAFITVEQLAACLDAGADPKAQDENGLTPLHLAAVGNENPAVIAALLEAGADLKARNKDGMTPLHLAAWFNGNPAVIAALLEAGADPKARDEFGNTPSPLGGQG